MLIIYSIFEKLNFKKLQKKKKQTLKNKFSINVKYSTLMHNIKLYSNLLVYIFSENKNSILKNRNFEYLILDSTLISTKKNIKKDDFTKKIVTKRNENFIAGLKIFAAIAVQ